jgi:hypothetical protein
MWQQWQWLGRTCGKVVGKIGKAQDKLQSKNKSRQGEPLRLLLTVPTPAG